MAYSTFAAAEDPLAVLQLEPNIILKTIQGWVPGLIHFGISLLIAVAILFLGAKIIKVIHRMLDRSFERMEMEISLRKFLLAVIKATMYCILVFIVAGQIGVNSASIIALLGSAGIAVGLAVQGSLANFSGGVLILMMKPFRVGDYIISEDGEGTVTTIGLVYTNLNTPDNKRVVIPNGNLANSPLTNVTAKDTRRVDVTVGISYHSDLQKSKTIICDIFSSHPNVLTEEPIDVFVDSLAPSCVSLGGRGWVKTDDYWPTKWEITERIKIRFDEEGITIPYNQLDVHMK